MKREEGRGLRVKANGIEHRIRERIEKAGMVGRDVRKGPRAT